MRILDALSHDNLLNVNFLAWDIKFMQCDSCLKLKRSEEHQI